LFRVGKGLINALRARFEGHFLMDGIGHVCSYCFVVVKVNRLVYISLNICLRCCQLK
jgi:hypothetical protein